MKDFKWTNLFNPEYYINLEINDIAIGLWVVLFIIFAETGLFAGFFLPGDSLLFLSGIYSKTLMQNIVQIDSPLLNVTILALLIAFAGILGNFFGYWFGKRSGNFLYTRKDSLLFKKKYLFQARDFYDQHGAVAIILARFLPIVRTFAPIVAGIVHMNIKRFLIYNVIGSLAWAFSLILAGHYLYQFLLEQFDFNLKNHIEKIVIGIVLITTLPVLYKIIFTKPSKKTSEYEI